MLLNLEFHLRNQLDQADRKPGHQVDVLLYFVLGHRTGRRQITLLFSAEQTVRIKKAFVGENEHCLLARIYSTHLWEGSKFQCVHHFF